ncbi:MAG: TetR/AcrR family transcriptional regulator [Burkholderiaceae bacterium]|jgi:AcrR family transcriptional regulator
MHAKVKPSPSRSPRPRPAAKPRAPNQWKTGRNRKEKSELVRNNLLWAAAQVVGEVGYAAASIARITELASVAQGTFYNYFESRQDILDTLLPSLGKKMLEHIREKSLGGRNFSELEERSFLAFFEFIDNEPHFFRILNEAESFAPNAHRMHFDAVSERYMRFLKRSYENGEFPAYEPEELEAIAFMLMATRSYLAIRYVYGDGQHHHLPENVAKTYMKFVRFGLEGVERKK